MPVSLIFLIVVGISVIVLALWYEQKHPKVHKDSDENVFKKPLIHP